MPKTNSPIKVAFAFFSIYIVWGTTYLAVIFGLKGFPPFILSALRFFNAGLIVFIFCVIKREKLPAKSIISVCIISGCLMLIGGSGIIAWCEKYVSSGHAATIMATTPFLFILLDRKRWASYFKNKLVIAGLVIGFLGLVLFVRSAAPTVTTAADDTMLLITNIVLLLSAVSWVLGSLYAKRKLVSSDSNMMTTSLQLIAAGVGCTVVAAFTSEFKEFSISTIPVSAWGGLLYLIIFGSVIAYLAFTWLLSIRPPAVVSTHTYINPVVAVLLGWIIADEKLTHMQIVGLVIILAGMLLVNLPKYITTKAGS